MGKEMWMGQRGCGVAMRNKGRLVGGATDGCQRAVGSVNDIANE